MSDHNTWSWGCKVPQSERANGDALDAQAICPVCEPKLPTTAGSVVWVDGFLMLTRWGNWVSDAAFVLTTAEVEAEKFKVIFDAGDPEQAAS